MFEWSKLLAALGLAGAAGSGGLANDCKPQSGDGSGGYAQRVAVRDGVAFVAHGYGGLLVLDLSEVTAPVEIASLDTPDPPPPSTELGRVMDIALADELAFLADTYGLLIVDVSSPSAPVVRSGVGPDSTEVEVVENLAFISGSAFRVVDVEDPDAPTVIGTVDLACGSMAVRGDLALLGVSQDVVAVDVGDPTTPVVVGGIDVGSAVRSILLVEDVAFIGTSDGVTAIDVSDPSAMMVRDSITLTGGARDLQLQADFLYVASFLTGGVHVVDVSDPDALHVASQTLTFGHAYGLAVSGDIAVVANHVRGVVTMDISDPTAPMLIGGMNTPTDSILVAASTDRTWCVDSGVDVLHVIHAPADGEVRSTGSVEYNGFLTSVAAAGSWLYASSFGALIVIDGSDPEGPLAVNEVFGAFDVVARAEAGLVAADAEMLVTLDLTDPGVPAVVGAVDGPGSVRAIAAAGGLAAIASENELAVYDIAAFDAPTFVGSTPLGVETDDLAMLGDYAYVAANEEILVVDLSTPSRPLVVGGLTLASQLRGIDVRSDQLVAVTRRDVDGVVGASDLEVLLAAWGPCG